ncbi:hypothetical protein GFM13_16350 [Rhizobium leguminosarum bv. viciae]|nr:hypothetical protein [Rhizobium leguminosarum bv. viciae]
MKFYLQPESLLQMRCPHREQGIADHEGFAQQIFYGLIDESGSVCLSCSKLVFGRSAVGLFDQHFLMVIDQIAELDWQSLFWVELHPSAKGVRPVVQGRTSSSHPTGSYFDAKLAEAVAPDPL